MNDFMGLAWGIRHAIEHDNPWGASRLTRDLVQRGPRMIARLGSNEERRAVHRHLWSLKLEIEEHVRDTPAAMTDAPLHLDELMAILDRDGI